MIEIGSVRLYNLDELSKKLGLSKATLRRYIKNHRLSGQRMGVRWYVSEHAVDQFFLRGFIKPAKGKARQK